MPKLKTNGHEVVFGDPRWETKRGIGSNNCYSYAMNDYRPHRPFKAVVGDLAGYQYDIRYDSCAPLKERLLKDNLGFIYETKAEVPCKPGFYKVMMVVASKKTNDGFGDFHFYKHHRDIAYKVQPTDTPQKIAKFFGIPEDRVPKNVVPGKRILLQDVNVFSHKLGWATKPLLTDSCGKAIHDPRTACRAHGNLEYDQFCGSYCVAANRVKTSR